MPDIRVQKIHRYGWVPDLPDQRDHLFAAPPPAVVKKLPSKVDLRSKCPDVYDQGQLGSCTANAIAAAIEFEEMKQKLSKRTMPSRLFIYYNERVMEGSASQDSGAQIRDGIKSVSKQGYCSETMPPNEWPYDTAKFAVAPPKHCYDEAMKHVITQYERLAHDLDQFRSCLASGYPFVFGFTVYESFESSAVAHSGDVPMPDKTEQSLGGHAVMAVGYDDKAKVFIVRNSWGLGWGKKGYFTIPYEYLTTRGLSNDFWKITAVQQPAAASKKPIVKRKAPRRRP